MNRLDAKSWALLLTLALVWGASFFFAEIALTHLGPITVVFWRTVLGAMVLGLWIWLRGTRLQWNRATLGAVFVAGLLNHTIAQLLIAFAQTRIEGGLAAILNSFTAPLAMLVAAALVPGERLTASKILGALLGVAGVAVIMGPTALSHLDARDIGQWASLTAALTYAFAASWARLRMSDLGVEQSAFGMLTVGWLTCLPLALLTEGVPRLDLPMAVWAALLGFGIVSSGLAYLMYYALVRHAGPSNASLVTLLVAPVAMVLGWLFLGEVLEPKALIGFALIALGLIIIDGRAYSAIATRRQRA